MATTPTPTPAVTPETAAQLAVKLVAVLKDIDCTDHRYDFALRLAAALIKEGIVG